ncbi:MAG: hypothetical protein ACREM8_15305, partial [Vulcanimicrobiaceae bacterium]
MNQVAPYRPAGSLQTSTALAPYAGAWNSRLAAHLLRRAGFGGGAADVVRYARLSMNQAVDALIRFPSTAHLPDRPAGLPAAADFF